MRPSASPLDVVLGAGRPVVMPGVWDALSARLAARAGFEAVFVSGYCVAGTQLALPDFGYLTQTEVAEVARRVVSAAPGTAVVVDADTGYGNPLNVRRTVELWEQAGAAGMFLEDQVWPKRCGHMAGKQVVAADEWLAKLRAACDHRTGLHVTARTDARAVLGLEAGDRAGADGARPRRRRRLRRGAAVDRPSSRRSPPRSPGVTLVANMVEGGSTPLLTPAELEELGFTLIVSPLSGLFTMVRAVQSAFATLRTEGTLRGRLDGLVDFEGFGDIVGLPEQYEIEQRYRVDPNG